jgi:molybdopterin-guanine dinucleotide biosynthesis protein A
MGRDKALVEIEGRAMAARVADALRHAGATEIRCIGGDQSRLGDLGLDVVPDRHPGEGPVGGLLTALDGDGPRAVAVLACDLVAPDPATIRAVVAALAGVDVAVPVVDGRRQWHHAVWDRQVRPRLDAAFAEGARSFAEVTASLDVADATDVASAAVLDADEPADLPRAAR